MKRSLSLFSAAALAVAATGATASLFATGGEETILGDNTAVHSFTNSGTFTLSQTKIVRILVVGGGGGGGAECGGGGARRPAEDLEKVLASGRDMCIILIINTYSSQSTT